jgi:hypothetical protein
MTTTYSGPQFVPMPIGPNTVITPEGLRHMDGAPVRVRTHTDARAALLAMQAVLASAVAQLLPMPLADGSQAWQQLAAKIILFYKANTPAKANEIATELCHLLDAANIVAGNVPQTQDIAALRAFCDNHILALLVSETDEKAYFARHGTKLDAVKVGELDAPWDKAVLRARDVPKLASVGADLPPFATFGDYLRYFGGHPDTVMAGGRTLAVANGRKVEVDLAPKVEAALKQLAANLAETGLAAGIGAVVEGGYRLNFRIHAKDTGTGSESWSFRFLANTTLN